MTRSSPAESETNAPTPLGERAGDRASFSKQVGVKLVMHVTAEEIATVADSSEPLWHAYCEARLRQFEKRG
jgi:hypothetical protein